MVSVINSMVNGSVLMVEPLIPHLGLLLTSPLGFKALGGGMHVTHSMRFTSGVTLGSLLAATSMVAKLNSCMYLRAGIGRARNHDP